MFKINGEQWFIKLVSPTSHALMRSDGTYTVGLCDDNTKTIYISDELYGEFLKKVIRHEVVHAAMFSYEVDLTLEQEEVLADLIATYGEEIINLTNVLFDKIAKRRERF